jgi:DNA-binding NtrC family response regulator
MNELIPRILVIDDDKSWLEQVPMIFEGQYLVDGVPTIDQGILAIETLFYDVILLDLNFDGDSRTGLDVFRRIHAADRGADVIVMSAEPNKDRLIEIFNAGVTRFISKPASIETVRSAFARYPKNAI